MRASETRMPDAGPACAEQTSLDLGIVVDLDAGDNELRAVQASAASSGVRVDPVCAGPGRSTYILHRWGQARDCATLADVCTCLRRMGVDA